MGLAGKRKISLAEMSQQINLARRLGRTPTPEELEMFAEMAIERINQRTLDGQTVNGGSFAPYSEKYAEAKGVSRNSVDLFLDGDMLDSLDYDINEDTGTVTILINNDEVLPRAYNHHVGDTLPRRPWFGITPDEVEELTALIPEESDETETTSREQRITLADLLNAVNQIDFE
jgi:hypothetical protein